MRYGLHAALFLATLFTTTLAGSDLTTGRFWLAEPSWALLLRGLPYSLAFLAFLSFHEFGHYVAARLHRVGSTLPYYIPIYLPLPGMLNIGSFGAIISLRDRPSSNVKYFDIGIAGPLAGFGVSVLLLAWGFTHLPDKNSYILGIHPEYAELFGRAPSEAQMDAYLREQGQQAYAVGSSLLFEAMKGLAPDPDQVPPHFEMMHYPFLFVGYITLFFTALNLLPIGQLDGGHVLYGMFGGRRSGLIARIAVIALLLVGGSGLASFQREGWLEWLSLLIYFLFLIYICMQVLGAGQWRVAIPMAVILLMLQGLIKGIMPELQANLIWLVYAWLAVRFVRLDHPPAERFQRLSPLRRALGWLSVAIFILCFSPEPIRISGPELPAALPAEAYLPESRP
jgi:Zn-dependent protease